MTNILYVLEPNSCDDIQLANKENLEEMPLKVHDRIGESYE